MPTHALTEKIPGKSLAELNAELKVLRKNVQRDVRILEKHPIEGQSVMVLNRQLVSNVGLPQRRRFSINVRGRRN